MKTFDGPVHKDIRSGRTPYAGNPAIPSVLSLDELATRNVNKLFTRLKEQGLLSVEGEAPQTRPEPSASLSAALKAKKNELERLACSIVANEFGVENGEVELRAWLCREGKCVPTLTHSRLRYRKQISSEVEPQISEQVKEEIFKRRMINAIIQGAGHKFQDSYLLYQKQLDDVHPEAWRFFVKQMASFDCDIWRQNPRGSVLPPSHPKSLAGVVEVDGNRRPPMVFAKAINFPLLLHELSKGMLELVGRWGLPKDDAVRQAMYAGADTLPSEKWDLRIGPSLWEDLNLQMPKGYSMRERMEIVARLFALPAREFLFTIRSVIERKDNAIEHVLGKQ